MPAKEATRGERAPVDGADRALLSVLGLTVELWTGDGAAKVADDVSFRIDEGEVVGLVGESGCGKSLTALSLARLQPAVAHVVAGSVLLDGVDLASLPERELARRRGTGIAYVPQDPGSALNPVMRVEAQLGSVLRHAGRGRRGASSARVRELLERVGLDVDERLVRSYPHELSGGMRQRVAIAMALAASPRLLVADEPTTALDSSLQLGVVALLSRLVAARDLGAVLLITHDVGVVAALAQRVMVMYAGRIVEEAPTPALFADPRHPYSRALLAALPHREGAGRAIPGRVPDPFELPAGCAFHPRCPDAEPKCREERPPLLHRRDESRRIACHLVGGSESTGQRP